MAGMNAENRLLDRRLRTLQGIYFLQTFTVALSRVIYNAWLLEDMGSRGLPYVWTFQSLPLCLVTFGLIGLVDRTGRASLMSAIFGAVVVGNALTLLGAISGVPLMSSVYLLFSEAVLGTLSVHFWLLASELLSPEQSRRHFPSLSLVGAAGAILAGALPQLVPGLERTTMLLIMLLPGLAGAGLAWGIHKGYPYRVGPRAKSEGLSWRQELGEGVGLLRESPLLLWITLLTATITASGVVVDYLLTQLAEQGRNVQDLASFFGGVTVLTNVIQALLVLTMGQRILTTFGLTRTLTSYPAGNQLLLVFGFLTGAGWPLVGLKVFDRLENYLILNPGVGIALNAFPRDRKGRASLVYGGLVKPLAISSSGAMLIILGNQRGVLLLTVAMLSVAFLAVLRGFGARYRQTLVTNLGSEDPRLVANSIEALAEPENRMVVPALLEFVERERNPVFTENVLLAAGRMRDLRFQPMLLQVLQGRHLSLKCAAVQALAGYPTREARDALLNALREEDSSRVKACIVSALAGRVDPELIRPVLREALRGEDPRVRANAVEAVGLSQDPVLLPELRPLLTSPFPRIRANAIVALVRSPQDRFQALKSLTWMFREGDRDAWISAAWAAGEVKHPVYRETLLRGLASQDLDVRRNAALALGRDGQPEGVPALVELLVGPPAQARSVARVFDRLTEEVAEAVLASLAILDRGDRARAIQAFRTCGVNFPELIEQMENLPEPAVHQQPAWS